MRRSYNIALSALSSAVAVIAIVAQAYVSTLTIAINIVAALAVSLPLTKNCLSGAVFSYIVAGLIGFFVVNLKALPFIMLYGLYAILQYVLDFLFYNKAKINKYIKIAIIIFVKIIYFLLAFWGCVSLMKVVVADIALFNINWSMPLFIALGFVCFCIYDPFYRWVFINFKKIVGKYIKGEDMRKRNNEHNIKNDSQDNKTNNDNDDIFGV